MSCEHEGIIIDPPPIPDPCELTEEDILEILGYEEITTLQTLPDSSEVTVVIIGRIVEEEEG